MSLRIKINEFVKKMVDQGINTNQIRSILKYIGLEDDRIDELLNNYQVREEVNYNERNNNLEKEFMSLSFDIVKLKSTVDAYRSRVDSVSKRIEVLEIKFNALLQVIFEYAPFLMKEWEKRVNK